MNYLTEPADYAIEVSLRGGLRPLVHARCRALGVSATSNIADHIAYGACARKIVAMVCPDGGTYMLRRYSSTGLLCTVFPPPAPQEEPHP